MCKDELSEHNIKSGEQFLLPECRANVGRKDVIFVAQALGNAIEGLSA